ncbi:response regulator [Propionimicrobium sp. PCR01-08-3]|uniref:response regulator n=1 Tax=Propionimicrobium sp. PCR01-08-3 TaxID=3052086 RepID=UPI00255CBDED|nr:response regulator [Propionimicrobium sp. PCR01-08-3]WIY81685.1 response regulator [Propionimicrobium sp. PCR01-08-3]
MGASASTPTTSDDVLKVIIYSDDRLVREQMRLALGRKIAADLPEVEISEFATPAAMFKRLDAEKFDIALLDAEARPGGMGVSHQMRDEIPDCPPVLLLIARAADAWMATWSRAEGVSPYPVDPIRLPTDVADVVRNHRSGRTDALSSSLVEPGVASRHGA